MKEPPASTKGPGRRCLPSTRPGWAEPSQPAKVPSERGCGTCPGSAGAFAFLCLVEHHQLLSPLSPWAGMDAAAAAPAEERSLESTSCKNGPSVPGTGTPGREPPAWQDLHAGLLRSGIVCLPGTAGTVGPSGGCRERPPEGKCRAAGEGILEEGFRALLEARKPPSGKSPFSWAKKIKNIKTSSLLQAAAPVPSCSQPSHTIPPQ